MPPKAKFTKEQIVYAALEIARSEGVAAVTARAIGTRLGSSARPIFTVFQNMEEVQQEVARAAKELYNGYVKEGLSQELAFKGVGAQYIRFAIDEPKLFQLLFMSEQIEIPGLAKVLSVLDDNEKSILLSIQRPYDLDEETARKIYQHLWIYTHGIASLCATSVCEFNEAELNQMLTEIFISLLQHIKSGGRA